LNGVISGWNPQANPTNAITTVDNSGKASYTGITIAQWRGADFLYAANFGQNSIDVFDSGFNPVARPQGAFVDDRIPPGFSVFNVQAIGDTLFVTYASLNVFGSAGAPGEGYVDIFNPDGMLLKRLRHGSWMNAPWGVTLAPAHGNDPGGRVFVGMFGSGQIARFDIRRGNFHGLLRDEAGQPITIGKGLWGLGFGNGATAGPADVLYFATDVPLHIDPTGPANPPPIGIFGALVPGPHSEDVENDGGGD